MNLMAETQQAPKAENLMQLKRTMVEADHVRPSVQHKYHCTRNHERQWWERP